MLCIQEVTTMLFKLYKYDMKSIIRQLLPIWILAPILSIAFGLSSVSAGTEYSASMDGNAEYFIGDSIVPIILGFALFGVFVALAVLTLLFIIQRFWKGLLGDEGYLMFTLPVKTSELIISKMLSALTIGLLSTIDAIISIMCMVTVFEGGLKAMGNALGMLVDEMKMSLGDYFAPFLIVLILVLFVGAIASIYQIYISMAIGQTFNNHRIAASVIVYAVISMVLNTLESLGLVMVSAIGFASDVEMAYMAMVNPQNMISAMLVSLVLTLVLIVVYHIVTNMIFKKKLNLV